MRVVVTGGAGYLGCWAVRGLLEAGHSVRVLDRFCFGAAPWQGLPAHAPLETFDGDVRRLQEVPALFDDTDAVLHLAGLTNDPSCDLDISRANDVNIESTIELAKQAASRSLRFVFASACSVYGNALFDLVDEESPVNPVSSLGQTKLEAENAILRMATGPFAPVVARLATLFGWSPRMRFDLAINQMVATALRHGRIVVRGGGQQWRPFVHVRDAATALIALLEAPADRVAGHIFNVGVDENNLAILDLARRVAGKLEGVQVEAPPDDDDRRSFRVSFAKLREQLAFRAFRSIDDGIAEVRARLEAQPDLDPFASRYFNVARMKELLAVPVDEGGEPVASRFIPLAKPSTGEEEEQAMLDALRSGWLTSGPQVHAFETAFAQRVESPHAVAVNSCTAALHLCLVEAGVQAGDEVITSPITWASTGNTLLNMGAKIVFADVDPATLNITPESIERAITPRTRAIIPVDMAGLPCDLHGIQTVAARHGIPVIEDAAHALGAVYKGAPIGSVSEAACFSFYAIKNITTIEGGMITLRDPERAQRLRLLASNGLEASAWERYGRSAAPAPQEVATPGFKYALNNVGAAIGLAQLRKLDAFLNARRRAATLYRAVLHDIEEIMLPEDLPERVHAWHLFVIRLRLDRLGKTRNEVAHALRRENVGTGFHFYGLHLHRYYRDVLGMKPEDYPHATQVSNEVLSLPLHPQITPHEIQQVGTALKKVIACSRR